MKKCKRCKGQGSFMIANGPDDIDHEPCDDCDATGTISEKVEEVCEMRYFQLGDEVFVKGKIVVMCTKVLDSGKECVEYKIAMPENHYIEVGGKSIVEKVGGDKNVN